MLIEKIAEEFGLPRDVVQTIVSSAPFRYKVYDVKKKTGIGTRRIAQPAREVKAIQRYMLVNVIHELPVHESAMAYKKGCGIRKNAVKHVQSDFLLKMDFSDFFPSLRPNDLIAHIGRHLKDRFDEKDIGVICRVCFWSQRRGEELRLSIGGPSSPFISNTLMFEFDEIITTLSRKRDVIYTRYADDLTFSTSEPNQLKIVETEVQDVLNELEYPHLAINQAKTVHVSKKYHRRVTGLVLSSQGRVSLGRKSEVASPFRTAWRLG